MRFEDLKRVWREEGSGEYRRVRVEELSTVLGRASTHVNRMVRFELLVSFALLLAIVLFSQSAIQAHRPLLAWPGAVLIWVWLAHGLACLRRLRQAKPDPGLPVREAVHAELERIRIVKRFRETYLWYLILTFIIGNILFLAGLSIDPQESLWAVVPISAAVLAFAAWGLRGNRRELKRVLRPLEEELQSWIVDLEQLERASEEAAQENSHDP
ncbi:MAG: hypothetical protein MI919_41145 [Holophagales bacterium]|nr:hypothetical protein [Holophagales bacterium]